MKSAEGGMSSARTGCMESRRSRGYHPQLVAVYHQCEALYIIKPQENTRWRVMRYSPAGADDIHDCVVMIYQACGLDKKILVPKNEDFLGKQLVMH